ncbi:MAG TPA: VWA domain-containing protein [Candidatus Hydrogenedentes bacterium]|nr:VWA domain-containing protein [Candidatus Hydrogenedentota bacterium]
MVSRRAILAFCVLVSLAAHFVFWYYAAPRITLLRVNAAVEDLRRRYPVRFHDISPEATPVFERSATRLTSRPGEIRDLVTGASESLVFDGGGDRPPAPTPDLDARLASDAVTRDHALEPDAALLRKMDARIVEIGQEAARRELQTPRRVVRPSPVTVIDDDAMPVLRDLAAARDVPPLQLPSGARSLLARSVPAPGEAPQPAPEAQAPPREELPMPQAAKAQTPAPAPVPREVVIETAPVVEAVRRQRQTQYEFLDDMLDIGLDVYQSPGDRLGFFRLRIAPRHGAAIAPLSRDITFVLDASSSISQRKLDLSARGLSEVIGTLRPEDNFNIVLFRDTPTFFRPAHVPATRENTAAAAEFLRGQQSSGKTDVFQAMQSVIRNTPRPGAPGIIVLISDGRPTTGMRDSRAIINALTADNRRNTIFAFGGGRTVNRYLLDLLAYRNRGESHVIDNLEQIPAELPRFLARIEEPLLLDPRADYGRIDETMVFPKAIPDFYRGRGVTVYGRYDPARDREFVMRLVGTAGEKRKEVIFRADLSKARGADREIARSWAFAKGYDIIGEISRVGEQPEMLRQLHELSAQYGFQTSYTE